MCCWNKDNKMPRSQYKSAVLCLCGWIVWHHHLLPRHALHHPHPPSLLILLIQLERQFLCSLMMSVWEGLFLFRYSIKDKTLKGKYKKWLNHCTSAPSRCLSPSRSLSLSSPLTDTHTHTHTHTHSHTPLPFCVTLLAAAAWHLLAFFRTFSH